MAATFIAGAAIQAPPDHCAAGDLFVGNIIIAVMLATISALLVLAADTRVRSRAAADEERAGA